MIYELWISTSGPEKNGRDITEDIFSAFWWNKNCVLTQISMIFVRQYSIGNKSAYIQVWTARCQILTSSNDDLVHWHMYMWSGKDELTINAINLT